jgi:hypothetical protein
LDRVSGEFADDPVTDAMIEASSGSGGLVEGVRCAAISAGTR